MIAARSCWSAALLCTAFAGCLFPDYQTATTGGGSGGQLGASGVTGTGGTGATEGSAGTGASGGGDACPVDGCTEPEGCTDGVDDDGDGKTDCFDADCASDPACAGKCLDAAELPCDAVRTGKDSSAPGSTSRIAPPVYNCITAEHAGPEFAYRFTGPPNRDVFVQLYGLDGNLDLMLLDVESSAVCDATRACSAHGSAYNDNRSEALGFASAAGRDYFVVVDGPAPARYSLSIACSLAGGCKPVRAIEVGQTLQASTVLGTGDNVTQNVSTYSCAGGNHSAPEAAFFFTPTEAGNYVVRLDNPTANVNLFVLGLPNCDGTCLTQTSASTNNARQNEAVTFMAAAHTGYFVVVDGAVTADFELSITKL